MNFGFDFPQSNPCLFRPGQFIDLTSPVENTTYSQKYANNMACGETSAHGRENLGPHNQSVQFFQSQTSSNEQRTQKSEKKNKRKKNAAIRRAIEKKDIQKRQQEMEVERCQAILASISQEQNFTRSHDFISHKSISGNAITLSEQSAKEALKPDGYQSELRQSQGASAEEYDKNINIVSTTIANQASSNSRKLRLMARNKNKAIQNSSKKRRRGKNLDEINSMISNAADKNEHILTTDMANSVKSWKRADNQILDKLNEKDDVKNLQLAGIVTNSPSVSEEKQKEQYFVPVSNHQEVANKKAKVLNHTHPRKRKKKAAGPKSNSASFLNNTLTNEDENLNLLKSIPVIDLSSPVLKRNVLSVTGGTNNNYLKKKTLAKSKEIQACNTTTKDTTASKSKARPMSKKAMKRQIKLIKRLQREAANQVAINDGSNPVKTGPDKVDIQEQSQHEIEKINQAGKEDLETHKEQERPIEEEKHEEQKELEKCEVQEPHLEQKQHEEKEEQEKNKAQEHHVEQEKFEPTSKKISGYIEPYKTDTEKEVLSLMRELLGIVR